MGNAFDMKNLILCFKGIISDILIYTSMVVLGIIGLPFSMISKKMAYFFIRIFCLTCFMVLKLVSNIRVECRGIVPDGNVLICAKHMSFLDILILAYYLPNFSFVMKKELIWTPIIGIYALRVGCVPVVRGAGSLSLKKMVNRFGDRSKSNEQGQIVIYPQGTRVAPGERKKFKIGAGVLYQKFGLQCHLVSTNSGVFWPKGSFIRRPGLAIVEFNTIIPTGLDLNKFMKKIETDIESASDKLIKEAKSLLQ